MANIMDILQSQVSGQVLEQLTKQVGGNTQQTSSAVNSIFGALLGGLSKNVQSPQGANALLGALDRDHDGSVLDDLMGLVSGQASSSSNTARALNGAGILKHILGGKQQDMTQAISKESGLDAGKVMSLMTTLAPMLMGVLGKQKKQGNLDAGSLSNLIKMGSSAMNQNSGLGSIFTSILDKDGDGSVVDDLAQSGVKSLLGRLFGRKR